MSKNKTVISNAPMINSTRVWTLKKKRKKYRLLIEIERQATKTRFFQPSSQPRVRRIYDSHVLLTHRTVRIPLANRRS